MRAHSAALGFEVGAHALRATAATNALDHQADIAKVQAWLGYANIAITWTYDRRKSRPEDSPTFKVVYWRPSRMAVVGSAAIRVAGSEPAPLRAPADQVLAYTNGSSGCIEDVPWVAYGCYL